MDTTKPKTITRRILADALTVAETLHLRLAEPQDTERPDHLIAVLAISQGETAQALHTSTSEVMIALQCHRKAS